jgi:hypothetical protein
MWRWKLKAPTSVQSISVLEPASAKATEAERKRVEDAKAAGKRVVPFGFARALEVEE